VARKRAAAAAETGREAEDKPMGAGLVLLADTIARVTAAVGVLACDEGGRRRFWCPDPMRRPCTVTAATGWQVLAACATVAPTPLARHLAVNALSRCANRSPPSPPLPPPSFLATHVRMQATSGGTRIPSLC
jgi:hypothetical protein